MAFLLFLPQNHKKRWEPVGSWGDIQKTGGFVKNLLQKKPDFSADFRCFSYEKTQIG